MKDRLTISLYKAKLLTCGKKPEQIKSTYEFGQVPSEEEIQIWIKAYDSIDGIEVIVTKSWSGDGYTLISWQEKYNERIRDFIYQGEQDAYFGCYINNREEFLKDWDSGEYSPDGALVFAFEDVEIIEELKKDQQIEKSECKKCGSKYVNKDFGMCESCCEEHFEKLG